MTPEKYVKQFYPDAFCEYSKRHKAFAVAIKMDDEEIVIGKSEFFERIAWQNAKEWLVRKAKNHSQLNNPINHANKHQTI
jgi:hypothetical protein